MMHTKLEWFSKRCGCEVAAVGCQVDITILQAILLALWRRRASGNVNVAYLIEAGQIDCHHHL